MAKKLWGALEAPVQMQEEKIGKGSVFWSGSLNAHELYPSYKSTAELLNQLGMSEDFISENNTIRFGHRRTADKDIYFLANRSNETIKTSCTFRASGEPELWSGVDGSTRKLNQYQLVGGNTTIDLEFVHYESYFVVFNRNKAVEKKEGKGNVNFPKINAVKTLEGSWNVSFDPKFGGPENIQFDELLDWTEHELRGIKYYSGIATYNKVFNIENLDDKKYYIDLGVVNDIARVKLNGKDIGVVWCAPWRIDISEALKEGENELEIEVANRWINRLLGDRLEPDANVRSVKFDNGLLGGKEFTTGRYTFTTTEAMQSFKFTEPLSSGLLGPVSILEQSVK